MFNFLSVFFRRLFRGRLPIRQNVEYKLTDKDGNTKPIWKENLIARISRKLGHVLPQTSLFGHWTDKLVLSNLVVNAGKAEVANLLVGESSPVAFTYIAIGTDATAEAVGDTALGAEITTGGGARAAATVSRVTTDVTNDTAKLEKTFTFSSSFAITESGVFNDASAGDMLARKTFSTINVTSGDNLAITWQFDID